MYLGVGSISTIIHILARLPYAAKTAVVCMAIVWLCR
jgi:hypothetical protein